MYKVGFIYNGEDMTDVFDTISDLCQMVYEAGLMNDHLKIYSIVYID